MSPAESLVRALVNAACLQEREPSVVNHNAYWAARTTLISELDALRARCEAAEKLLAEARDTIDTLPGYPKGADCCDRIDAHLKGAGRE